MQYRLFLLGRNGLQITQIKITRYNVDEFST